MGNISKFLRLRGSQPSPAKPRRGFMMRLARDVRANTLVIMGLSIIPLAGMVGGGLDLSRMYILKTRLQHACDAGALAGRKTMGSGVWTQTVNGVANFPNRMAEQFFDGNFLDGSYGSYQRTRTFTETGGRVAGTASAMIPMTLMKIFRQPNRKIEVVCSADMRLPNTDVMFVLDTTGSMSSAQPGDTVSKMDALKVAVKCFYEIVAKLNTTATCTTGAPSGGTGNQVQIRFGFVPYATNVNVGRLLKPEWFADSWAYQTRTPRWWIRRGDPSQSTSAMSASTTSANCNATRFNSNTNVLSNDNLVKTNTVVVTSGFKHSGSTCSYTEQRTVTIYDWREGGFGGANDQFIQWRYAELPVTVGLLKNGSSWNSSFEWPINPSGGTRTVVWDGCIEERQTVAATDYDPIPIGAHDLDIDLVPTGDDATKWGPLLDDVIFTRNGGFTSWTTNETVTTSNYANNSAYACAAPAVRLQQWPTASDFDTYVDTLTPSGNTYHDIGLIWGGRLISPTGLFRSDNEFTAQGGEIERHLIFMTDGDACIDSRNYTAYGVAWFDRRQTDPAEVPGQPNQQYCTGGQMLVDQVNLRTEGICTAIKNKNITLWVVAFGNLATSTETRLSNCASPSRYFKATNGAALQQTFKNIADQISSLRLTS